MRQHLHIFLALVTALASLPAPSAAQRTVAPPRGFVGGELLLATPVGEFAENVGTGFGIGGFGRYALGQDGLVSLRADLAFMNYGSETIRICVNMPCRVTGDLTTSNNIVFGGIGPELGAAGRRVGRDPVGRGRERRARLPGVEADAPLANTAVNQVDSGPRCRL